MRFYLLFAAFLSLWPISTYAAIIETKLFSSGVQVGDVHFNTQTMRFSASLNFAQITHSVEGQGQTSVLYFQQTGGYYNGYEYLIGLDSIDGAASETGYLSFGFANEFGGRGTFAQFLSGENQEQSFSFSPVIQGDYLNHISASCIGGCPIAFGSSQLDPFDEVVQTVPEPDYAVLSFATLVTCVFRARQRSSR